MQLTGEKAVAIRVFTVNVPRHCAVMQSALLQRVFQIEYGNGRKNYGEKGHRINGLSRARSSLFILDWRGLCT